MPSRSTVLAIRTSTQEREAEIPTDIADAHTDEIGKLDTIERKTLPEW